MSIPRKQENSFLCKHVPQKVSV